MIDKFRHGEYLIFPENRADGLGDSVSGIAAEISGQTDWDLLDQPYGRLGALKRSPWLVPK